MTNTALRLSAPVALVLALAFGAPAAAQEIPEAQLRQNFDTCVDKCTPKRGYARCAEICGCVAREMDTYWTASDFTARTEALRDEKARQATLSQIARLGSYCADRTGPQSAQRRYEPVLDGPAIARDRPHLP